MFLRHGISKTQNAAEDAADAAADAASAAEISAIKKISPKAKKVG